MHSHPQEQNLAPHDPAAFLANIAWHCMDGPHAGYSQRAGGARRYATRFAPVAAFVDPGRPDLTALAQITAPDESLYLAGVAPRHALWECGPGITCQQMLRTRPVGPRPNPATPRRLGPLDVPALQGLVDACQPGPFAPAMLALGEFFGIEIGGRLAACAGTRFQSGGYRELSTVCVHPDFQGRGLAAHMVHFMAARIEAAGEQPFLHVAETNTRAIGVYERCGFALLQKMAFQVVRRRAPAVAQVAK